VFLYGIWGIILNTICRTLNAAISVHPMSVDRFSRCFINLVKKVYRGMHPVGYLVHDGSHFIDISALDDGERDLLVVSLTELVHACFGSGKEIPTWLVENAIHEAFKRAMNAREAMFRALYQNNGTRKKFLLNLFGLRIFEYSQRPPDIPIEDLHGKFVTTTRGVTMKKEWCSDITVDELHSALSTVCCDIMDHHPDLYRPPHKQKSKEEAPVAKRQPLVWRENAALEVFEESAKTWGSLDNEVPIACSPSGSELGSTPREPEHELAIKMQEETAQFKARNEHDREVEALEKDYKALQDEIAYLTHTLENLENENPIPSLHDIGRDDPAVWDWDQGREERLQQELQDEEAVNESKEERDEKRSSFVVSSSRLFEKRNDGQVSRGTFI
jgi:hypothetical protein